LQFNVLFNFTTDLTVNFERVIVCLYIFRGQLFK